MAKAGELAVLHGQARHLGQARGELLRGIGRGTADTAQVRDHARVGHVAHTAVAGALIAPQHHRYLSRLTLIVGDELALHVAQRRALAPPQRRAGRHVMLERGRAGIQRADHEQTAKRMAPQRLLLQVDRGAAFDFRLDPAFDQIQEGIRAATAGLRCAVLIIGGIDPCGVVAGARRRIHAQVVVVTDEHQYRRGVRGQVGEHVLIQHHRRGVAIQHVQHRRRLGRGLDRHTHIHPPAAGLVGALEHEVFEAIALRRLIQYRFTDFLLRIALLRRRRRQRGHADGGRHAQRAQPRRNGRDQR